LNDDKITVSGYVAANKTIISNSDDVYFGSKYDNSEKITVPNVWNNVYTIAQSIEAVKMNRRVLLKFFNVRWCSNFRRFFKYKRICG